MERLKLPPRKQFDYDNKIASLTFEKPGILVPFNEIFEKVFSEEDAEYVKVSLSGMVEKSGDVRVYGNEIRVKMGCQRENVAGTINMAVGQLTGEQLADLGPLANNIRNYDSNRFSAPDIDIVVDDGLYENVKLLMAKRFEVKEVVASENVKVLDIKTDKGVMSIVKLSQSRQSQTVWPMYGGIYGDLKADGTIVVDKLMNRVSVYPLEIPGIDSLPPTNPQRFAAVARAMVWMEYEVFDGNRLPLPSDNTMRAILETIMYVYPVMALIEAGKLDGKLYSTALRDFALALVQILPYERGEEHEFYDGVKSQYEMGIAAISLRKTS